jgi:glutathione S-transferase
MTSAALRLFHAPNTRSAGALMLLEEIGQPFTLHTVNMKAGEQQQPAFRKLNPLGKVPTLKHGEAMITEQVAIFLYLADLFPAAKLAPALDDMQRGPYLRWLVTYGTCFEPAVTDIALKREPPAYAMSAYGSFDALFASLVSQLEAGPYLLGDRFSAADLLWGIGLSWTTMFKLLPDHPTIAAYISRVMERPAVVKVREQDAALAAQHAALAPQS